MIQAKVIVNHTGNQILQPCCSVWQKNLLTHESNTNLPTKNKGLRIKLGAEGSFFRLMTMTDVYVSMQLPWVWG